jgi:hypothetical protein
MHTCIDISLPIYLFVFIFQSDGLGVGGRSHDSFAPFIPLKEMNAKTGYATPGVILEQSNEEEKEADGYSPYPKGSTERDGDGPYPKGKTAEGGDININDLTKVRPYDFIIVMFVSLQC